MIENTKNRHEDKMRVLIIICLILMAAGSMVAGDLSGVQAAFVDIGFGARAMGMGGAYTAAAENAYATSWNPAGINWQKDKLSLAFSNVKLWNIINYNQFAYVYNFNKGFAVGQMVVSSGDDIMSETSIYTVAAVTGNMIPGLNKLQFSSNLSFGLGIKYFSSNFGNNDDGSYIDEMGEHQVTGNSNGYGLDFALNWRVTESDRIGLIFRNAINNIAWDSKNEVKTAKGEYDESLPAELVLGYAKYITDDILAVLDWNVSLYDDVEDYISTGMELPLLKKMIGDYLVLRGGYSRELYTGNNEIFSFGTGLEFIVLKDKMINLDIAYQVQTQWEKHNSFRISFCVRL